MGTLDEALCYKWFVITGVVLTGSLWIILNGTFFIRSVFPSGGGLGDSADFSNTRTTSPPSSPHGDTAACSQLISSGGCSRFSELVDNSNSMLECNRILVIVYFDANTNYQIATKIFSLYSRVFRTVVFCGPDANNTKFRSNNPTIRDLDEVAFVAYGAYVRFTTGESPYLCLPFALNQMPEAASAFRGFLIVPADSIVLYWNLKANGKNLDENWLIKSSYSFPFDIDTANFCSGQDPNNTDDCFRSSSIQPQIMPKIQSLYDHLERLFVAGYYETIILGAEFAHPNRPADEWLDYWFSIRRSMERATGGLRRLLISQDASIFYVAQQHVNNVSPLLEIFGRHQVPMNVAVTTTLAVVTFPERFIYLSAGKIGLNDVSLTEALKSDVVKPFRWQNVETQLRQKWTGSLNLSSLRHSCIYCRLFYSSVFSEAN